MQIKPEHSARLEEALEQADVDFWSTIVNKFPEALSGDFPPEATYERDKHNREMVLLWLHYNAPEVMVGEEQQRWYIAYFEDGSNRSMFGTHTVVHAVHPLAIKIEEA